MTEPVDPNEWQPQYSGPPQYSGQPPTAWQPPVPMTGPMTGPMTAPPQAPPWPQHSDYLPYPPPPPPRSHTRMIVAIVAAAVLVVAGVVAAVLVLRGSDAPAKLAAPSSVAGYDLASGAAADRVQGAIRGMASGIGGSAEKVMNAATIAVYSDQGDLPDLVLIGLTRSEAANVGAPADDTAIVQSMLAGAVSTAASTSFPAGPHGGALRCGVATFGAASETMCAWSDSRTVGVLVSVNPPQVIDRLAQIADEFRDVLD